MSNPVPLYVALDRECLEKASQTSLVAHVLHLQNILADIKNGLYEIGDVS